MCELLKVSRSGFYEWASRPPSDRELHDAYLIELIGKIHAGSGGLYGSPRIHAELREEHGIRVGEKRVARLMRRVGIEGAHVRRKRSGTTTRVPGVAPAEDLVERDFDPSGPNELWVADLKEVPTGEGKLYLAAVTDCFSRRIVGWSMAEHMRSELVVAALEMAVSRRRPGEGLVHHSDHGSQPGLNRSSQQCVREMNLGTAGDGCTGVRRGHSVGVARLSSRRLARRAGRSGDSRMRAVRGPSWARPHRVRPR
jgi:putative transposase